MSDDEYDDRMREIDLVSSQLDRARREKIRGSRISDAALLAKHTLVMSLGLEALKAGELCDPAALILESQKRLRRLANTLPIVPGSEDLN